MATRAIFQVSSIGMDFAAGSYNVSLDGYVADGVTLNPNPNAGPFDIGVSGLAQVPFALSQKKADSFLRARAAALVLAQVGLVADPDDIWFPQP